METIKVSPKYQVVIPLKVVQFEDRIELIPLRSARSLRGSLRGLDTDVPRNADRV